MKRKGQRPSRWRRTAVAAGATLALGTASLGAAAPAHALPWSSHVDVWGFASCTTGVWGTANVPAKAIWMYVAKTGEIEQSSVNGWTSYFSTDLHTIPSGGSPVQIWVYCAVIGSQPGWRYAGTTSITRPWTSDYSGPWFVWE